MSILLRGGRWWLRRRVPLRYHGVEDRRDLWLSLHTDSRDVAAAKATTVWAELVAGWEARLSGDDPDAARRLAAAQDVAAGHGYPYLSAARVAARPVEEIVDRVERSQGWRGGDDAPIAAGLLGGAGEDRLMLSGVLDLYWRVAKDRAAGKSPDRFRRWTAPKERAMRGLIEVVGKPVAAFGRDDALAFRDRWLERIAAEGLSVESARKEFASIKAILRAVVDDRRMAASLPLEHLRIVGLAVETQVRLPFSAGWLRDRLLAPGALAGLNADARGILLGMVNTGYRPSEGAALETTTIRLDGEVPHISIEPAADRQIKNRTSRRLIPLAGVSLEVFQENPGGFERYRANSAGLSAVVNKYLRSNGLAETGGHTMCGLRHGFEDRLLEAGVDERLRRDLMGHSPGDRQRYGAGGSMALRWEAVRKVAL